MRDWPSRPTTCADVVELAPDGVSAPSLLHEGNWAGRHLLVMSAVDGQPMPATDELPVAPMRRLAEAAGTVESTLGESDFLARLRADVEQVREKAVRDALADHLDVIAARFGDQTLRFGAWHGDWVPWNMARHGDEVLLWDWEHYEEGVPVGFDALHFRGQQLRNADRKHLDRGEETWWAERRSLLARLDVPAEAADLTAVLYLLRVNVRFVIEGQSDQDVSPRRVGWALPLLATHGRQPGLDRRRSGCLSSRCCTSARCTGAAWSRCSASSRPSRPDVAWTSTSWPRTSGRWLTG